MADSESAGRKYLVADHLGSTRMTFGPGYSTKRYDYMPFGEAIGAGVNGRGSSEYALVGEKVRFTGQVRDFETGLDYFGARYYGSAHGRFLGVDPDNAAGRVEDPQSWNGYSYVRNSPLVLVDPDGQDYQVCGGYAGCGTVSNSEFGQLSLQLEGNGYIVQNGKFMTRDQVTFGTYQYFYGAGDRIRDFALLMAERAKVSNGIVATVSIGSGATAALRSGLGLLAFRSLASLFGQGAVLTQWPTLGSKLDFLFGLAREVGPKAAENVARSREMLRHMQKIGLPDTAASRAYVSEHLAQILNTSSNIVSRSGTRVVRESLLMGPRGGVKLETVWEDSRLITIMVKGSK